MKKTAEEQKRRLAAWQMSVMKHAWETLERNFESLDRLAQPHAYLTSHITAQIAPLKEEIVQIMRRLVSKYDEVKAATGELDARLAELRDLMVQFSEKVDAVKALYHSRSEMHKDAPVFGIVVMQINHPTH